jgi:DNA repair exonuclease SbcCD nuclease subunit
MKFLHCADLHIDSPLAGLPSYEGAPTDEIRGAARRAFENLVATAIDAEVTAVLVAGDLLDGDRDDFNTATFVYRQFRRLVDAGIGVFVVYGNHDADSKISRRLPPPEGVTVFGSASPETVRLESIGLCIHGQSYPNPRVSQNLAASFPAAVGGLCNVGLLHTSMAGREGPHERYAPCTEGELVARGYQYWALGHIHQQYIGHHDDCWVVYPGNLQGRHARELGPKGACLVTYDESGVTAVEPLEFDVVRWEVGEVDVSQCSEYVEATTAVAEAVESLSMNTERTLALRLIVTGSSPVASALLARREEFLATVRAAAPSSVYIEKLLLEASPPASADNEAREAQEAQEANEAVVGEAVAAVGEFVRRVAADERQVAELTQAATTLRSRFGAELGGLVSGLSGDPAANEELLAAAERLLLAELTDGALR